MIHDWGYKNTFNVVNVNVNQNSRYYVGNLSIWFSTKVLLFYTCIQGRSQVFKSGGSWRQPDPPTHCTAMVLFFWNIYDKKFTAWPPLRSCKFFIRSTEFDTNFSYLKPILSHKNSIDCSYIFGHRC